MDWRTVRFDWNQARSFLITAEEGSYSAAARALGVAQPTVGRQVQALEDELGVVLFERVGRGLQLTESGLQLVDHVRSMGQAATRVSLAAAGQSTELQGTVSITASQVITAHLLPPVIARLRREHPGIELELVADNTARDLRRREADIAVRNFRPQDPELVARKLPAARGWLYGTPAYLASLGEPVDLSRAEIFAFPPVEQMVQGLQAMGLDVGPAQFPVVAGDHLVQWELCRRGIGLCVMMEAIGDADDRVVRLPGDLPAMPVEMWITCHRELRASRRLRVVFDALVEELSG